MVDNPELFGCSNGVRLGCVVLRFWVCLRYMAKVEVGGIDFLDVVHVVGLTASSILIWMRRSSQQSLM